MTRQERQKQDRMKKEENLKMINIHRMRNEEILNEKRHKYLDKIEKINERYLISKQNKEKQLKMKYNKIYINANNVNADYMRNQMADVYHRKEKNG